jgi:cellulase (glycosyl hydrolase family 5)
VANDDLQLLALIHGGDMPGTSETLISEARHAARIARENLSMQRLRRPPMFELGNEPTEGRKKDYWKKHPETFGKAVDLAAREIWRVCGPETLVISGGIHNPSRTTQAYLKQAARYFPHSGDGNFAVGFHDYAPGMGDPRQAHPGFRTVDEQVKRLQDLGYRLFDTESGGHTAAPESHTDDEIARWLADRLDLSVRWGLLGSVVFQLNDGPDPKQFEHRFGLLRTDRSEKPSAKALSDWLLRRPKGPML